MRKWLIYCLVVFFSSYKILLIFHSSHLTILTSSPPPFLSFLPFSLSFPPRPLPERAHAEHQRGAGGACRGPPPRERPLPHRPLVCLRGPPLRPHPRLHPPYEGLGEDKGDRKRMEMESKMIEVESKTIERRSSFAESVGFFCSAHLPPFAFLPPVLPPLLPSQSLSVFPGLYLHMLTQRKKTLAPPPCHTPQGRVRHPVPSQCRRRAQHHGPRPGAVGYGGVGGPHLSSLGIKMSVCMSSSC